MTPGTKRIPDVHIISPFVVTGDPENQHYAFLASFLNSPEFTVASLRAIGKQADLVLSQSKASLANAIANVALRNDSVKTMIVKELIEPTKKWVSISVGRINTGFHARNPVDLLTERGMADWYGPIVGTHRSGGTWYIRPHFIEYDTGELFNGLSVPSEIRWLVFARLDDNMVSLHWKGFTAHPEIAEHFENQSAQFAYWKHIPPLFDDLAQRLDSSLECLNLHDFILNSLWSKYRKNSKYFWRHNKVRAESGGVFLNAKSAGKNAAVELEIAGLLKLANMLRRAIEAEIKSQLRADLPDPEQMDETITDTIVRELGTLSYEFELDSKQNERVFRGNSYFGLRPHSNTPDAFPHIGLFVKDSSYLDQCEFLFTELKSA